MTGLEAPAVVLFDWNGTIIDDMERARRASSLVRQQWTSLGELTLAQFRQAWRLPLSAHVEQLGVPEKHRDAAVESWKAHLAEAEAPLSPGTVATLEALRRLGIEIAVVSSNSEQAVQQGLRGHGLDRQFEQVHCGAANKEAITSQYVIGAGEGTVWYVGDTTFDMMQAVGAGAVAIGFTGGYGAAGELRNAGANLLIDRMDELLTLIPHSSNER